MTALAALVFTYIDSAVTTTWVAAADTYYVVDTAVAAVTITLPAGVAVGHWVVVQNAPAGGPQLGGGTPGNPVTVAAGAGETLEGSATDTVIAPVSLVTAAAHKYFPTGPAASSGFGVGWVIH